MAETTEILWELEQIRQLKARYFRLMDTKQWDEWAELFTPDARLRFGPGDSEVLEGREAIVATIRRVLADGVIVHHGHSPELEITGPDSATGIWAMADDVWLPDMHLRGAGHYFEEYRKEDGQWRIASSELVRLRRDVDEPSDHAAARSAITDLVARYNVAADVGRFDEAVSLFTDDAVMELPNGLHPGREAIRAVFTTAAHSIRMEAPGAVRHLTSTIQVDLTDQDHAVGRAYYLVMLDHGPDHWGRYIDEYRKIDGRWYFSRRQVTVDGRVAGSWAGLT